MILLSPLPPPGSRAGVAVSGGADSTALLVRLVELREYRVSAIHVNHGWRGAESDADARFCRALAERLRIPFHERVLAPPTLAEGNPEETARLARLQFFGELIETKEVDYVLTAHTRNDQAETVLFRLLRGASLQGLAGIHPVVRERILRPMLRVTRADVIEYLRDRGELWREDSSNADTGFRRNRIRRELLPQLERDWNPEVQNALARTAELAWDEQQFWNEYTGQLAVRDFRIRGNTVQADASILMKHPKAVARRLIRWAVERVKGDARQIGLAHIEAVMELAARQHDGHGRVILPGVDVMRSFEWIRFSVYAPEARDHVAERNWELPVAVPGEAIASDGSRIRLETVPAGQEPPVGNENDTVETSEIACEAVVRLRAVTLRNWRPGDKYRPSGHGNVEKLKAMFQECRVPLWDRATWPIISIGEEIIWSRKFGPAACGVEGKDASGSVLRITRFE